MSLLKTLISQPKASPIPKAEDDAFPSLIEHKASVDDNLGLAHNNDPEHPNHAYRQHLLKRLKARNSPAYNRIMDWE